MPLSDAGLLEQAGECVLVKVQERKRLPSRTVHVDLEMNIDLMKHLH